MPEGLEAEIWRRACGAVVGRTIVAIEVDDRVAPPDVAEIVIGRPIVGVGRVGKVVTLDLNGVVMGLHFGMTGRLVVDGISPIEKLEYASGADRPEWDRLRLLTGQGSAQPALRLNDPRRLGRVSLDDDLSGLGPDAFDLDAPSLAARLATRRAAIKTLLLDQHVVAGLGNLCADEVLFHAGIDPRRGADSLTMPDIDALAESCRDVLPAMLASGGSTTGVLDPPTRRTLGPCPLDGAPLERSALGGRTTVWCSGHQVGRASSASWQNR